MFSKSSDDNKGKNQYTFFVPKTLKEKKPWYENIKSNWTSNRKKKGTGSKLFVECFFKDVDWLTYLLKILPPAQVILPSDCPLLLTNLNIISQCLQTRKFLKESKGSIQACFSVYKLQHIHIVVLVWTKASKPGLQYWEIIYKHRIPRPWVYICEIHGSWLRLLI